MIASRIGALPAAIRPGDNGWLFEPGDAAELAELLRRLHHDRALLGRAAEGIQAGDVTAVAVRAAGIEALLAEAIERPVRWGSERRPRAFAYVGPERRTRLEVTPHRGLGRVCWSRRWGAPLGAQKRSREGGSIEQGVVRRVGWHEATYPEALFSQASTSGLRLGTEVRMTRSVVETR